jgi:RNA polymerase sigma-70 factor (ECF subfamily)
MTPVRSVRSVDGRADERSVPVVTEIGDGALVLAAREGDRKAEERLVLRHAPVIAAIAARLLGSRQDAEDVAQDALIAAITQLDRLREPAAFRSWLTRITVLRVRATIRRRRIARTIGIDVAAFDVTLEATAAATTSGEVRAELALIDRVLDRLPTDLRIAWMLRYVEGLELTEVADACGCSLATIKRRIAAADEKIREHVHVQTEHVQTEHVQTEEGTP